MPRQPLALGYQEGRSKPLAASRLINLYFENASLNSRAPKFPAGPFSTVGGANYGTPGLKAFVTAGTGKIRAARFALNFTYLLSGADLYRIAQDGTTVLCTGDRLSATGTAMMTDNGIQLCVLSAGQVFTVVGTIISRIISAALPSAGVGSIDTIDGYTIFTSAEGAAPVYGAPITITGITQANPAVVTAPNHGFVDNQQVLIQSVLGMTQLNNRSPTLLVVDTNTFQLIGIDSTGYGLYVSGGTAKPVIAQSKGQWFISALYDSASIAALDFATAEAKPDPLLRVLVANREIWLFGSQSIEPWQDTGASPFPFERITGSLIEKGTAAALSPAELTGTVFWLGDDKVVYMAVGYNPQRISNYAVENAINEMSDVSDAFGMVYTQDGHAFYVLTFITGKRTFVYDIGAQTPTWHERRSGTQLTDSVWGVNCIVAAWGKIFAGTAAGHYSYLDLDTYDELGAPIRAAIISTPFYNDGKNATMPLVEIETELGVGISQGQGVDPKVMVRWSDDGGATWSNERQASLGKMGDRIDRAMVRRLGLFRQREIEFSISDPVKRAFYGMRYTAVGANA